MARAIDGRRHDWHLDAIFYQLYVRGFQDSNGDGHGDLSGVIERLDYLADLGVTCLWLMPIFPSPRRDDGYDVSDFLAVDPSLGSLADLRRLIAAAHQRNLRIITDLVLGHTSSSHPWFQSARRDPDSPFHPYYVWSVDGRPYRQARVIFRDSECSNWSWDPGVGKYYWHRFYSHQPDLNYDHPPVQEEILAIMRFWLDLGLDGFRVDAVPYLFERDGTSCENLPATHDFCRRMRALIDADYPGRILLAEANQPLADLIAYFGAGDEFQMAFHFPLMTRLFLALGRRDSQPLRELLALQPALPPGCQWATFARNHDELTLEMVSEAEREELYRAYAGHPRMKHNLGIRRRLAPLLGHDRRRIQLLYSLLLALPGAPVLYYGDEIGMGDDIHRADRGTVRTPMQWSAQRNGGFSSADPRCLYQPLVSDHRYHYRHLNVEAQQQMPGSLLSWLQRRLRLRGADPLFSRGALHLPAADNRRVLALLRRWRERRLLLLHNLSGRPQVVRLDLPGLVGWRPLPIADDPAPQPRLGERRRGAGRRSRSRADQGGGGSAEAAGPGGDDWSDDRCDDRSPAPRPGPAPASAAAPARAVVSQPQPLAAIGSGPYRLQLQAYACLWLQLLPPAG